MPIYEYRCTSRGPFDVDRPITKASRPAPCPACSEDAARQYVFNTRVTLDTARERASLESSGPPPSSTGHDFDGVTLTNCTFTHNGTGMRIGQGARVRSFGGVYRDNAEADVDNSGHFESTNDRIG